MRSEETSAEGRWKGRRTVAVIVSRFPLITETFILREIGELERQGQPVLLVPMIREFPDVMHEEAKSWVDRALFTPFFSAPVAGASLRALRRQPKKVLEILRWIVFGSLARPRALLKSLLVVPKSIYIAEQLAGAGIEHIHAHFATFPTTIARIVHRLTGIGYSFTVHAHDIFVDRTLLAEKIEDCRFIRSISIFNKAYLEHLYPAAAGKIAVVHVGIEPENYGTEVVPRSDDPLRILTVAALKPYKGIPYLIEACRLLDGEGVNFQCEIIGTGPMRSAMQRLIARHKLQGRVRLRGALAQDTVARAIGEAHLLVLPSIIAADNQMEGIPVALMEAMAAGKPVVATAISGIPELIENDVSGLLVDPANPGQLAAAIQRLSGDEILRERLGRGGRQKVTRDFALATCVADLVRELDIHNPAADLPPELRTGQIESLIGRRFGVRRIHRRTDSLVAEVLLQKPGEAAADIIMKRQLSREGESRGPEARAAREQQILDSLRQHFAKGSTPPQLGVPEPITLDRAEATLVMRRARGAPLETLVRRARDGGRKDLSIAAAAAGGAGMWLARFQQAEQTDGNSVIESMCSDLREVIGRAPLSRSARNRLTRRVDMCRRSLTGSSRRAVAHHGDFWPGNIFATGSDVEVIDFEGYRLSLAAADVAYFLFHLELYFQWKGGRKLRNLQRCFLAGYGARLPEAELALCRIDTAVRLLSRDGAHRGVLERLARRNVLRWDLHA